jgi:general secretion pathway protein G
MVSPRETLAACVHERRPRGPGASRRPAPARAVGRSRAFTLIELLVVLAILALLLTIAAPRYIHHVDRAREATLRASLKVMREAIDKFYGDQGRWPESLDELVARDYLKAVPLDPITDRTDTWVPSTEAEVAAAAAATVKSVVVASSGSAGEAPRAEIGVADIHSGAPGNGENGTPYQEW